MICESFANSARSMGALGPILVIGIAVFGYYTVLLLASLIDAWAAFKDLSTVINGESVETGAIYGFLGIMLRVYRRYGGTVEIAWEGTRSRNFRKALYPGYKLRAEPDEKMAAVLESMKIQEPRLKAIMRALGIRQYEGDGGEADDVLAALASWRRGKVIIYTGDSDLRQLADDRVTIVAPGHRGNDDVIYDPAKVLERHGVHPHQIPCLKAISGDTGDCIPGVKGVGAKTAVPLLVTYSHIEKVIKAAEQNDEAWPVHARFKKMVAEDAENIRLYRKLTKINHECGVKEIVRQKNRKKSMSYFEKYAFRTLMQPSEHYDLFACGGEADDE
jgi:5'-3' exonuclease